MSRQERKAASRALEKLARRDGVSTDYVRRQIQLAMLAGGWNQDPSVQRAWKNIPQEGETLQTEDFIAYAIHQVRERKK